MKKIPYSAMRKRREKHMQSRQFVCTCAIEHFMIVRLSGDSRFVRLCWAKPTFYTVAAPHVSNFFLSLKFQFVFIDSKETEETWRLNVFVLSHECSSSWRWLLMFHPDLGQASTSIVIKAFIFRDVNLTDKNRNIRIYVVTIVFTHHCPNFQCQSNLLTM